MSFKYSIAHMYSSEKPPFIEGALPFLNPQRRTWLTVRDDDIHSFRWADSAFARAYIRNMPGPDKVAGFYMGPDGYNWGREAMSVRPETPRQLVIQKKWFSFLLWGRLSFDPGIAGGAVGRVGGGSVSRGSGVPAEGRVGGSVAGVSGDYEVLLGRY